MSKRVVLVGHCGVDGPRLKSEIEANAGPIEVLRINDQAALESTCEEGADLLLVNREPVGFDDEGLDIIRSVRNRYPGQKVMLVSDYPDAQEQAIKSGALPGFGKADIGSPKLIETVKGALSDDRSHGRSVS